MGRTVSLTIPSMANTDSMPLEAPMAWPIWDLFADTGGMDAPKTFREGVELDLVADLG